MKSSTDRFAGGEDDVVAGNSTPSSESAQPPSPKVRVSNEKSGNGSSEKPLPPWKQAKRKAKAKETMEVDVVIAAPPEVEVAMPGSKPIASEEGGFRSATSSTFKGDRGGTAEVSYLTFDFMGFEQFKWNIFELSLKFTQNECP